MVTGRPPSQACRACRAKRKACDQKRPKCVRCLTNGLQCSYPEKKWRFCAWTADAYTQNATVSGSVSRSPTPETSIALDRSATLTEITNLFWLLYAPEHTDVQSKTLSSFAAVPYLLEYRDLAVQQPMVQSALHALSLVCVAHHTKQQDLFHQAMPFYGKALNQVNHALQDANQAGRDEVLATCRILGLYEIFRPSLDTTCTQGEDYIAHAYGMCSVSSMHADKGEISITSSQIRRDALIPAVACSMLARSSKVVPNILYEEQGTGALQEKLLLQVLLLATWLDEHAVATAEASQAAVSDVFSKGMMFASRLAAWEDEVLQRCRMHASKNGHIFDRIETIEAAAEMYGDTLRVVMASHYTVCMVLCAQMWFSYANLTSIGLALPRPPKHANPVKYAAKAVHTITQLGPHPGFWALEQLSLVLTLLVCFHAVIDEPNEQIIKLSFVASQHQATRFTDDFRKSFLVGNTVRGGQEKLIEDDVCVTVTRSWYGYSDPEVYEHAKALWSLPRG